jgi:hypothetical protein
MASRNGSERVALVFDETEYTYAQLDALAAALAATLAQRGVRAGDRVALMSSNRPEWVVAVQAIWRLGAAVVLCSPAWKQTETEHALAITQAVYAVGDHPVLAGLMPMLHLDEPITPAAGGPPGVLEAGTVAAQRMIVSGMRDGRPVLRFQAMWYCLTDLNPAWDVRDTGWHVRVDGDAPLDIDIRCAVTIEQMGDVSPGYTANRAVNAVPFVCVAPPGIRTTIDLPQIVARLG